MSFENDQPEDEAVIQQRPESDAFGKTLVDVFAKARAILGDVELDITRDPSPGRPVDLS